MLCFAIDLVRDRFRKMENVSQTEYLNEHLVHLSIHDAVIFALSKSRMHNNSK